MIASDPARADRYKLPAVRRSLDSFAEVVSDREMGSCEPQLLSRMPRYAAVAAGNGATFGRGAQLVGRAG